MRSFLLLLCCALLGPAAEAKKKPAKAPPPEPERVIVEVPQTEIDLGSRLEQEPEGPASRVELGVSTWSPDSFTRASYGQNASSFRAASVPFLAVNRVAPFKAYPGNGAGLFWVAGASYSQLERTADVQLLGISRAASESLSLLALRAGLEYQGPRFWGGAVEPFVSAAFLPTYALAPRSELEERVSSAGLGEELAAGVLLRPAFLREFLSVYDGAVKLAAHTIFGSVDGSSLRGTGFLASFSATL